MEQGQTSNRASATKVGRAERRSRALQLRLRGATFERIGVVLGITRQAAAKLVWRALDTLVSENHAKADLLRALEVRRVEARIRSLWPKRADPRVSDAIGRAQAQLARLIPGLYAPEAIRIEDNRPALTEDERAAKIAAILQSAADRRDRELGLKGKGEGGA